MYGNYQVSTTKGYRTISISEVQEYERKAEALERRIKGVAPTLQRPEEVKQFQKDYKTFNNQIYEDIIQGGIPGDLEIKIRNINEILRSINEENPVVADAGAEEPQNQAVAQAGAEQPQNQAGAAAGTEEPQNQAGADAGAEQPQNNLMYTTTHPVYINPQTNSQGTMVGTIGKDHVSSRTTHNTSFAMAAEKTDETVIGGDADSKERVEEAQNTIPNNIVAQMKRTLRL